MSLFDTLELQPDDPIFGIIPLFRADERSDKINLSVGVYNDENGVTPVLDTVKKAEKRIAQQDCSKIYLPISGDPSFCEVTEALVFGNDHPVLQEKRVNSAQTIGASGALRLGAEFLVDLGVKSAAISSPTWANHQSLMKSGGLEVKQYTYYDATQKDIDFEGMVDSIKKLPPNSAILMHSCCHNPTGYDPSEEQWQILSRTIKECQLFPFFDCAYQGFKNSLDGDAYPIRLFAQEGHDLLVAYSYSKNMGLYGERAGALCCVSKNNDSAKIVQSYFKKLIRANYSSPPIHSAKIVHTILCDPTLEQEWIEEVTEMRSRIHSVRGKLISKITSQPGGERYNFLKKQCGMFSFTGLNKEQVQRLRDDFAVYMPGNGRINVAGLNDKNIDYFVDAFVKVGKD